MCTSCPNWSAPICLKDIFPWSTVPLSPSWLLFQMPRDCRTLPWTHFPFSRQFHLVTHKWLQSLNLQAYPLLWGTSWYVPAWSLYMASAHPQHPAFLPSPLEELWGVGLTPLAYRVQKGVWSVQTAEAEMSEPQGFGFLWRQKHAKGTD